MKPLKLDLASDIGTNATYFNFKNQTGLKEKSSIKNSSSREYSSTLTIALLGTHRITGLLMGGSFLRHLTP